MLFHFLFPLLFFIGSIGAVCPEIMERLTPYLLPKEHPAKEVLDRLLTGQPLKDENALRKAGFVFKQRKEPHRQVLCASHPKLKGYLVKAYLDDHQGVGKEEKHWILRIKGAEQIRASIVRLKLQKMMKVPRKWIYLLPDNPTIPYRRFVLVVEDMQILDQDRNVAAYYFQMSRERLKALYQLLTENLLYDSIYIDNIPFCKDGKIAFIDTEHFNANSPALRLHFISRWLCPPLAAYWSELIQNYQQP